MVEIILILSVHYETQEEKKSEEREDIDADEN